jgi:hypothetical protein
MRYLVLNNVAKELEVGVLLYDMAIEIEKLHEELAAERLPEEKQSLKIEVAAVDYSEEAIPERDPAYRPLDDTLYRAQTIELVPTEVRLALARRLEQLGMSGARAAMVANL